MLAFYKYIRKTDKEKIWTSAQLPKELQVATMKSESYTWDFSHQMRDMKWIHL